MKTTDKLDVLAELMEEHGFHGNILVAHQEEVVRSVSRGYADYRKNEPLDSDSLFELASVSKPMTAMGILLLAERGSLSLEDLADDWLPGFPYPCITIRQLLTHTSGLPDYMDLFEAHWDMDLIAVNSDVLALLNTYRPDAGFPPGAKYQYSNTGYVCLAEIITRASGMPYAEFLGSALFAPAGMTRTKVMNRRYRPEPTDNFALGWIAEQTEDRTAYHLPEELPEYRFVQYLDGIQGDGMTHSTVTDLLQLDRSLSAGTLLSKESMDLMQTPSRTADGIDNGYGCGWILGNVPNAGRKVYHSGGWPGYSTMFCRYPDAEACIIVLSNLEPADRSVHTGVEAIVEEIEHHLFS
ncbi:serine hydrolase domain-containing protein [Sporosarcina koreensis]|uniref:serine hydrolase domain-containing protein n=1 Tax=Sporosarcina koreensis TaxID=334735 RepID=UPI0006937E36|nr:serine hydrolase domain-containing protein [Sporosarcina koreensis]